MEKQVYFFETEDGEKIFIEVDSQTPQRGGRVGAGLENENDEPISKGKFNSALKQVKFFSKELIHIIKEVGPNEATIETGFKFNVKANCFVASSASEVDFKITLKWKEEANKIS